MSRLRILVVVLVGAVLAALAGCTSSDIASTTTSGSVAVFADDTVDGYVALVPETLRSGETASFSFTLFAGDRPAKSHVTVSVLDEDAAIASATAGIDGKGTLSLEMPVATPGDYKVKVEGTGFSETTEVRVVASTLLFLETDKPIYKPGQTMNIRLVALDSELRPVQTGATIEIQDAKGIKLSKQVVSTDEYGTVTAELPISSEPNLGVWKVVAVAGDVSTEVDVRVEEYVLPKYEVSVEIARDWFLVDEDIRGHVSSAYSYGKPVQGELKVVASKYVGVWEEYATFTASIDGESDFTIDRAGYVAGVPEAGGLGNVRLDITVTEEATGYEQQTTELVTVADSSVNLRLIAESTAFKPGLPFEIVLVTETPSGEPVESYVDLEVFYTDEDWENVGREVLRVQTGRGTALVGLAPPEDAVLMSINARAGDSWAWKELTTAHSPSGSFIHIQQTGSPTMAVGDVATFDVVATDEAGTLYYEVVSRDRVVFTSSTSEDISFTVTPDMAPSAMLLVYQILPSSEVAADSLPFEVLGEYPQEVSASFSMDEARPGDEVRVLVQTEGPAKVGLVAVDHSVFILAENRLNLAQVFAELERLYMQPQVELHEAEWMGWPTSIPGAADVFADTGLKVLTNKDVPEGKELESQWFNVAEEAMGAGDGVAPGAKDVTATTAAAATAPPSVQGASGGLAEVERVRQFFPETWIWDETITDQNGAASLRYEAPDSITTWDLRAVALSPVKGLGIAEASVTVFQPFFLQADLPYSAIRGEEFPVKIALYNYLDTEQEIQVELEESEWFQLLDEPVVSVTVAGGDVGSAEFRIRPTAIGSRLLEVSARSAEAADAVMKSMIVEPEGVGRETVENVVLPAGQSRTLALALPQTGVVSDSERAYVAVTGSIIAQTIDGLDQLLQMPFGCGEQNMALFAPDAYVLEYLRETRQLKPEIQAKAEMLLTTGYQRELTYRRDDGSFSAFGQSDESGSLWLTAFVLKCFAQAKDLTFIDQAVLDGAADWITAHQQDDGSFESVGFVCHTDMMGGVQGKDSLTAFVAIALLEADETSAAGKAVEYLEGRVADIEDSYTLALITYALELAGSEMADAAVEKLLAAAIEDDEGLHWSSGGEGAVGSGGPRPFVPETTDEMYPGQIRPVLDVEATGYATLALIEAGDRVNAAEAAKWLVGRRNSQGGFGSTQDTVVALQALIGFAADAQTDVEMTVAITAGDVSRRLTISADNYDVTQVVEVPAGEEVTLTAQGKGEAVVQGVIRFNLLEAETSESVFDITVDYDTGRVAVDDVVQIDVSVRFDPPEPMKANMTVLDISVPTGFAALAESLEALLDDPNIKRFDVAGRKVILYIEDMDPGDVVDFSFQAVALYPVRGKGAVSSVYSYYTPEWRGETVSEAVIVE